MAVCFEEAATIVFRVCRVGEHCLAARAAVVVARTNAALLWNGQLFALHLMIIVIRERALAPAANVGFVAIRLAHFIVLHAVEVVIRHLSVVCR